MARFASALAFLCTLAVILGSAGCGQRFEELGAGQPPPPADLAAAALSALEAAGSAHVVFDGELAATLGTEAQFGVHFEGDLSKDALVGDGEIRFPGGTIGARLLVGEHDLYVRFMGTWYHAGGAGIRDAAALAKAQNDDLLDDLMSAAGLRKRFSELFEGEVTEGPVVDGVETWQFEGSFRADTFANFAEKYDNVQLTDKDRALLAEVAAASRLTLVVGREDRLPRSLALKLDPPRGLPFESDKLRNTAGSFSVRVDLSDFGKDVSFEAPKDVKPLDALIEQFFSGFG
ncbi:MAG: hypothetical protein ABI649_08690 [Gaiellaceae bacterium]